MNIDHANTFRALNRKQVRMGRRVSTNARVGEAETQQTGSKIGCRIVIDLVNTIK